MVVTFNLRVVMCVIAKFGDVPRLSPNGTFLSRFQKSNPSLRSPLFLPTTMLQFTEPSSEALLIFVQYIADTLA
jgi:hypothetical protein